MFQKSRGEQGSEIRESSVPRAGKAGKPCQHLGKEGAGCSQPPWGAHLTISDPEWVGRDGEHHYL